MEFTSTPLFGGALVCDLPTTFTDASRIRDVPDHQEVWLSTTGFTNMIIEINQMLSPEEAPTDEDALKFHFKDLVESTEASSADETKFWSSAKAVLTKMPDVPCYAMFATQHNAAKTSKNPEDFTGVLMVLVRLERVKSDVVICVNVPHMRGEYDESEIDLPSQKVGRLVEEGEEIRKRILESLEVTDWNVFGEE